MDNGVLSRRRIGSSPANDADWSNQPPQRTAGTLAGLFLLFLPPPLSLRALGPHVMPSSIKALSVAFLLAGCAAVDQGSVAADTPPYAYVGKKCPVSAADFSAAVLAARHSKYFPGGKVHEATAVSRDEIHVEYGDIYGVFVFVKRIHGHWKAIDSGFWKSERPTPPPQRTAAGEQPTHATRA